MTIQRKTVGNGTISSGKSGREDSFLLSFYNRNWSGVKMWKLKTFYARTLITIEQPDTPIDTWSLSLSNPRPIHNRMSPSNTQDTWLQWAVADLSRKWADEIEKISIHFKLSTSKDQNISEIRMGWLTNKVILQSSRKYLKLDFKFKFFNRIHCCWSVIYIRKRQIINLLSYPKNPWRLVINFSSGTFTR